MIFMIEECCGGVILTFTKDVLINAPKDKLGEKAFFENLVRSNPRLYNSCAAFAPGSPLMEGIDRPRNNGWQTRAERLLRLEEKC